MPHIPADHYDQATEVPEDEGELTYGLYALVCEYAILRAHGGEGLRYKTVCAIRGSLMGAMDEFNRLVAHPYEDTAIARNGDATPEALRQLLVEAQMAAGPSVTSIPGTEAQMQMTCPVCGCAVGFIWAPDREVNCPNCHRTWTVKVEVT